MNRLTPSETSKKYRDMFVVDVHNHGANYNAYRTEKKFWDEYSIDKVVLFGGIGNKVFARDDQKSWEAYEQFPNRVYPFVAGFDVQSAESVQYVKSQLQKGFFGVGEVIIHHQMPVEEASIEYPGRGLHPMDAHLPDIYRLCAEYKAPVLVHMDVPHGDGAGEIVERWKQALREYPDTVFIWGHGNAFNRPSILNIALRDYPNLYIDFFAGYTVYGNTENAKYNPLLAYVPIIEKYPNRFMVSTDSAAGLNHFSDAYEAIFILLNTLSAETRHKVAGENFEQIITARKEYIRKYAASK